MKKIKLRIMQFITIAKYIFLRLFSFLYKNKYQDIWLISERGDEARDNGYCFYKYLKDNHPEINVKYVITKNSCDINLIDKDDQVLARSAKHIKLYIFSKYLISTHIMGYAPEFRSFAKLSKRFKFFRGHGKNVFLQHGITQANIPELKRDNTLIDLFVTGAKPEYDYIKSTYGYKNKEVIYTGFSRYDYLDNSKSNYILLMTTWRKELFYVTNNNEFSKTAYFKNINKLIRSPKIKKLLEDNNLKLLVNLHYELQKFANLFESSNKDVIICQKESYRVPDLINGCKMLITDYSSVSFDVAYLYKPVIYYQYDYEDFIKKHYNRGYFDYKKNGFGPVCEKISEIEKKIEYYIKHNFIIEDCYKKRIDETFVLRDKCNSERIFNEIIKL